MLLRSVPYAYHQPFLQLNETVSTPQEYDTLREAHSELQLLYRERTRELETMTSTITAHSSTYDALQKKVQISSTPFHG